MAKALQRLTLRIRRGEGFLEKVKVQCGGPDEELVKLGGVTSVTHGRPPWLELWELGGPWLRWSLPIQESVYLSFRGHLRRRTPIKQSGVLIDP